MPSQGGFSFKDTAEELANNLVDSLVTDVNVELDFAFVLDLNPMFDEYTTSKMDRIPNRSIQINHFKTWGTLGLNEWTSSIDFSGLEFVISEAVALLDLSSTLSSSPIRLNSPSELIALVTPPSEDSDRIVFEASLDIVFPVFLMYDGIGYGTVIEYQ